MSCITLWKNVGNVSIHPFVCARYDLPPPSVHPYLHTCTYELFTYLTGRRKGKRESRNESFFFHSYLDARSLTHRSHIFSFPFPCVLPLLFQENANVVAMVSRKRNQGKARKAKAKAKKELEERENNHQATNGPHQQSLALAAQMQRLQVGRHDTTKCMHGFFGEFDYICTKFVFAFRGAYSDATRGGTAFLTSLKMAECATSVEFAEVWNDCTKMELVMSFYLYNGTQHLLDRNNRDSARECAIFARYFEQYIAVELHQTQATMNCPKICEMTICADEHTLVKFFRTRITCSCLDEKYHEVKSVTKIAFCWNPKCNIPNGQVQRSETMYCSGCRGVTYCSRGCQKADWKKHKEICNEDAAIKSEFDAKKQP